MRLIVNPHKIEIIKDEAVNEREIDISKCTFEFAEEITQEYVKEAYFTYNGETYKQIINNNECAFPSEVLEKKGMVEIGVVAYLVENEQEIKRYNPSPAYFNTLQGSLKDAENSEPITPSEMEQFEQQLQNGLNSIDDKLDEVDTKMETVDTKIDEIDTAIEETNNLDLDVNKQNNKTTVTLTKKNGSTKSVDVLDGTDGQDGTSLEFMWQGTSLGIKTTDMQDYAFVDLQGIQGPVGETGAPFTIKKTYSSIAEMNADFDNMELGDYVMIASSVELEDNAKLFTKGESAWIFITDFSGAMGIRGETGLTPNIQIGTVTTGETSSVTRTGTNENPILNFVLEKGEKGNTGSTGPRGETGNGIASVTKTSTSGLTDTYTITYTNGNTSTFTVTNGKGISSIVKTSTSGLVDTYTVTFNDNTTMTYTVTNGKDGIDGEVTQEQLDQVIKDLEYWKTTNNALPKVTGEGTDITLNNTADSPLSLGFKASDTTQYTTSGKNLLPTPTTISSAGTLINGVTFTFNEDGTITANGTSTDAISVYLIDDYINYEAGTYTFNDSVPSGESNTTYFLYGDVRHSDGTAWDTYNFSTSSSSSGQTKTIPENFKLKYRVIVRNGITLNNVIFKPQFELSSTATDYEPFTGMQPSPNPDFPQEIHTINKDNANIVENKNLFDKDHANILKAYFATSQTTIALNDANRLIYISAKPNTTYTIQKLDSAQFYVGYTNELPVKDVEVFGITNTTTALDSTHKYITITTGVNAKYIVCRMYQSAQDTTYTLQQILDSIQIEMGNVAIPYTPHKEQNYPISLGVKNLFDKDNANIIVGYIGNNTISQSSQARTLYITCEPNTTYTISKILSARFAVGTTINEPILGEAVLDQTQSNNATNITITTSSSVNYLCVFFYHSNYDTLTEQEILDSIQIEEGSVAHSYSPYGQEPIEMCKIGNYQDLIFKNTSDSEYYDNTLEENKWYKLSKVGKVVLDGSEDWQISGTGTSNYYYYITGMSDANNTDSAKELMKCNRYIYATIFGSNTNQGIWYSISFLRIRYGNEDTVENFKNWLSTHNTIVYYILETPTKTLLSDTLQTQLDDISYAMAYQDQTNISQVNEDRPFVISANTIKDMKTLEDRITALEESISL
jgi:hypothetical protein